MRHLRLIPLALALVACGDENPLECTHPDDCGEGQVCQGRLCIPAPDAGCMRTSDDTTCDAIDDDCDGIADEGWQGDAECGVGACRAASTPAACIDGEVTPCAPGAAAPADDTCDTIDDDCDGSADEDWLGEQSCGVGACQTSSTPAACTDGVVTPCAAGAPAPIDDTCDAIDDDCDGMPDDDWLGEQTCGLGPCAATATPAACSDQGVETPCVPGPASDESCNGQDDDCDGAIDETFDVTQDIAHCGACGIACEIPNGVPFCDGGSCRLARCEAGFADCNANPADGCETQGPCPPDSNCDGIDDDGDGAADEGFVPTTGCGVGLCGQLATPSSCIAGAFTACAAAPEGVDENCNGLDEDCDGAVDEGFEPIRCGQGACEASATPSSCEDGREVECQAGAETPEVCDGLVDEDCDGDVDEGFDLNSDPRNCGRCGRLCARPGSEGLCIDGDCVPGPCAAGFADCNGDPSDGCEVEGACPADAACDGVDDDGDGRIDEGFAPALECGVGACAEGVTPGNCVAGELFPCRPGPQSDATDGICDGIDGDCDGRVDEGYAPDASCGVGACAAGVVPSACVGGVEQACAAVVEAVDETCDGTDEDCDGALDEGFGLGEPCAVGIGLCARAGRMICVEGDAGCDVEAGRGIADVDCDGLDADCDGVADEAFVEVVPAGCIAAVEGACASGATADRCVGGQIVECAPAEPVGEACDGIDNDCDGLIDNQEMTGFDPEEVPFARIVVGNARRGVRARLAWTGERLAVVWYEFDAPLLGDIERRNGGLALIDPDVPPAQRGPNRLVHEEPLANPLVTWDGERLVLVWSAYGENDRNPLTTRALDGTGAALGDPVEVLGGLTRHRRGDLVTGPDGAIMAWTEAVDGDEVQHREIFVGQVDEAPDGMRFKLTSNSLPDDAPLLVGAQDRVGLLWRRLEEPGDNLYFRVLDGQGRALSTESPVARIGYHDFSGSQDHRHTLSWGFARNGRGFLVSYVEEQLGEWRLFVQRLGWDGGVAGQPIRVRRNARITSRGFPALWVPALQATAAAWSEEVEGRSHIVVGLLDPLTGALTRGEVLPEGVGEQINPTDLAWAGDRLAVVWEEKVADDDWRLVVGFGTLGCGRERCVDGRVRDDDTVCDGIDADCDGAVDESHRPVERCHLEGCAEGSVAGTDCVSGWYAACRPSPPPDEICNGIDNDCDGLVDEAAVLARHDFETGTDGWGMANLDDDDSDPDTRRVVDPPSIVHHPGDGVSGGLIRGGDPDGDRWHFSAPALFLGDRSGAIGGLLRFRIRLNNVGDRNLGRTITLIDSNGRWVQRYIGNDLQRIVGPWQVVEVALVPEAFRASNGAAPSTAAFRQILGDLSWLLVPGEWNDGPDAVDLDWVEWVAPPCP